MNAEESTSTGIERLEVWRKAVDIAVGICKDILPKLPGEEKWCLANQLRRSAQSIPANIAEGVGRFYYQETVHFCYIARGSLEETYNHLMIAQRLGYIQESEIQTYINELQILRKLISGYINYLKRTKRGEFETGNRITEGNMHYSADVAYSDVDAPESVK